MLVSNNHSNVVQYFNVVSRFLNKFFPFSSSQFRAEKGSLPEAGDMEQAEAVYDLAKAVNAEDGGFSAEGLEDSKVGREDGVHCTTVRKSAHGHYHDDSGS